MILLDTNVLSALMRQRPEPAVVAWLDRQPRRAVATTVVTLLEVRTGLAALADGRRRRALERAFEAVLDEDLGGRVLPVDRPAAEHAATIQARLRGLGRGIEVRDLLIAGIAASRNAILATRNLRHFEATGVRLLDPWTS